MERKKLFAILSKVSLLVVLWGFAFDVLDSSSGFVSMARGLTAFTSLRFVFGYLLLAVLIALLYGLSKLNAAKESNTKPTLIILILTFIFGFLALITSYETDGGWWLMMIASIAAYVFGVLSAKEAGEEAELFTKKQLLKASKIILLLIFIAFFQPVACGDSGYEVIDDFAFEFDGGIFIGAWLLIAILVVALFNLIVLWRKDAKTNMNVTYIECGLSLLFLILFQIIF